MSKKKKKGKHDYLGMMDTSNMISRICIKGIQCFLSPWQIILIIIEIRHKTKEYSNFNKSNYNNIASS